MAVYDRDYLTTLPLLYEKAAEYSEGDWNKYNDDVGDTLLKLLAATSHTVDYYFRRFLTALVLPNDDWNQKSLIWELTGYKPNYLRADYLMVQLYWPDCGLKSYVPIYQYTPFKVTADGKEYVFLCAEDYIIPPLTTRANIRLVNGSLVTIDQDYTEVKNNKIKLSDDDIDYDLVTVIVSGNKWTQVRNVFYSPNTERIFSVHKETDGTYLYLHKTWKDYIDAYDTSFVIYYVKSYYDFTMFTDDCMTVEFQTELLTLDGDDVSQYYRIIPLLNSEEALDATNLMPSTTEGNRAITVLDFENNAALFPGIASCRAYDWNTFEVCKTPFEVVLVACDSKGRLSEHMKQVLKAYLESICSPLINVNVVAPNFAKQDILVVLDIGDYKGTVAELELKKVVVRALEEFYDIGNLPPGRVVKTRELNSLILHTDSRIYFVTTSFINPLVKSPLLIPVLGNVIVITSAEAFTYYDFGLGVDKGYMGLTRFEFPKPVEMVDGVTMFFALDIKANLIVPIDKIPLQVFEQAEVKEGPPVFGLPVSDFGYGSEFIHVLSTGGAASGQSQIFVFETDGNSVLLSIDRTVGNVVQSELKFENSGGTFFVDPGISVIPITDDNIDEIKEALANAFNSVENLVDADGKPFTITADEINFPIGPYGASRSFDENAGGVDVVRQEPVLRGPGLDSEVRNVLVGDSMGLAEKPVLGDFRGSTASVADSGAFVDGESMRIRLEEPLSLSEAAMIDSDDPSKGYSESGRVSDAGAVRLQAFDSASYAERSFVVDGGDLHKSGSEPSAYSESALLEVKGNKIPGGSADSGVSSERVFVYIPYNNVVYREALRSRDKSDIRKINFVMREYLEHSDKVYQDFNYESRGRYSPDPNAYGRLTFSANVNLSINDNVTEYVPVRPEMFDETAEYGKRYAVRSRNGRALTWYFVDTSVVNSVVETTEIGYGIYVGFDLVRDMGVYVETDEVTSRGFIYSSEMQASDFTVSLDPI